MLVFWIKFLSDCLTERAEGPLAFWLRYCLYVPKLHKHNPPSNLKKCFSETSDSKIKNYCITMRSHQVTLRMYLDYCITMRNHQDFLKFFFRKAFTSLAGLQSLASHRHRQSEHL